jgi:hypothetical protein
MGGTSMSFLKADGSVVSMVGLQIVKSADRTSSSSSYGATMGATFSSSSELCLRRMTMARRPTTFSRFRIKSNPPSASRRSAIVDPFANDDGTNVTYGNAAYKNANWTDKALASDLAFVPKRR